MKLAAVLPFVLGRQKHNDGAEQLGDFTTTRDVIPITLLAICIGVFSAFVALAVLRLIGIFTNLFFYQRWGTALVSPAGNRLGRRELQQLLGHGDGHGLADLIRRDPKVAYGDEPLRVVISHG